MSKRDATESFKKGLDIDLSNSLFARRLNGEGIPFPGSPIEAACFLVGLPPLEYLYNCRWPRSENLPTSVDLSLLQEFLKRRGHDIFTAISFDLVSGKLESLLFQDLLIWAKRQKALKGSFSKHAIFQAQRFLETAVPESIHLQQSMRDLWDIHTGKKGRESVRDALFFQKAALDYFRDHPGHRMSDFIKSKRFPKRLTTMNAKGDRVPTYDLRTLKRWVKNVEYNRKSGAPRKNMSR